MKVQNYQEIPSQTVTVEGVEKVNLRRLITQEDGAPNFIMRMFDVEPGGHFPDHAHEWEHEVFVLEGEGILIGRAGEGIPLVPGDVVFIGPDEEHYIENRGRVLFRFIELRPI